MNNISCCIIAVQKDEPYVNDWIEYHIKQGFSHIFIIDNNDKGNELFIPEQFKSYVSIFPANSIIDEHISRIQYKLYNFVLDYIRSINSIKQEYTHVLCIDIDEYFYYAKGNINYFIQQEMNDDFISLFWQCYDDNNIIYKKDLKYNSPVLNYTHPAKHGWITTDVKTLAKITDKTVLDIHFHNHKYDTKKLHPSIAHIKHYRTQCVEEYIDKINLRRCTDQQYWFEFNKNTIQVYFNYNEITNEKLDAFKYFYKKYNMIMSKEDSEFIEKNYI